MDSNTDTNLKPCPFCGSEPVMRRGGRYGFWALCPHCGAALRMSDTEADAANAWNRRATEAEGNQATQEEPSSGANPDAETVADIRAWLANGEVARCLAAITDTDAMHDMLTAVADRIEAALAREREMSKGLSKKLGKNHAIPGDAAAMREALEGVRDDLWDLMGSSSESAQSNMACEMSRKIRSALSEPARNCDVGTADEQADRFKAFCYANRTPGNECSKECPFNDTSAVCYCQARWAQMPFAPAEGGDNA